MDNAEIQILAEHIILLRKEKRQLDEKIKEKRDNLMSYMEKENKRGITTGDYIIERKHKYIKTVKKGLELPKEAFEIKTIYQLHIKTKNDITLIGNKFVITGKKND